MYSRNMRNNRREISETTHDNFVKPPPNYRGMVYDRSEREDVFAEGIDRLVNNDDSYQKYERVEISQPVIQNKTGLHRLIDGLSDKSFCADDVLICAMIILMLNNSSEDDILMVLVLMMLL